MDPSPNRTSRLDDVLDGTLYPGDGVKEERLEDDVALAGVSFLQGGIVQPGMCSECDIQSTQIFCRACGDEYCEMCFHALHRKGHRKTHHMEWVVEPPAAPDAEQNNEETPSNTGDSSRDGDLLSDDDSDEDVYSGWYSRYGYNNRRKVVTADKPPFSLPSRRARSAEWFKERTKWIPIRLAFEERKFLRLLEAVMETSTYTDNVDVLCRSDRQRAKRLHLQVRDICAVLSGLVVAYDYDKGQELLTTRNYGAYASFFQMVFEIGRRYKIMNPEKMRSTYGKLLYFLQDSASSDIQDLLGFSCVSPIKTVYRFLEKRGGLAMLEDPYIEPATIDVAPHGRTRSQIRSLVKKKEKAVQYLSLKYKSTELSGDEIKQCLYSIADNHEYLSSHRDPVDAMIQYLQDDFSPDTIDEGFSLAITGGHDGSRLTHNHHRQYYYVLQSMTLWRDIAQDMYKLWQLSEEDILSSTAPYKLVDTGQGLHRVQPAPRVGRAMRQILYSAQRKIAHWVGSSVIHLGDNNVPNALMFIDKYNQVSRILNPIRITLSKLEDIARDDGMHQYIEDTYGGVDQLRKTILLDFFTHAFDGSGGNTFIEAGSCIDGRLTSAWDWCSKIDDKAYYAIFKLAGFKSFDGEWGIDK